MNIRSGYARREPMLETTFVCYQQMKGATSMSRGNHFWQRGYFVDSVGANEEIIRRYVKHQDKVAKEEEERQQSLEFTS